MEGEQSQSGVSAKGEGKGKDSTKDGYVLLLGDGGPVTVRNLILMSRPLRDFLAAAADKGGAYKAERKTLYTGYVCLGYLAE